VDLLLDKMHEELLSKTSKNVDVIHLSAQITRALMGRLNIVLFFNYCVEKLFS
jgi:hypothetical protein